MLGTLHIFLSVYSWPGKARVGILRTEICQGNIDKTQIVFSLKQILKIVPEKLFPERPRNMKIEKIDNIDNVLISRTNIPGEIFP